MIRLDMKFKILVLSLIAFSCLSAQVGRSDKSPHFKWNGGLRFNCNFQDAQQGTGNRGGGFGYDVPFSRLRGEYRNLLPDAGCRLYSQDFGGVLLRDGRTDDKNQTRWGLTGVPFGIRPSAACDLPFRMSYCAGPEDDSDMGIRYLYAAQHWEFALAFFKNVDERGIGYWWNVNHGLLESVKVYNDFGWLQKHKKHFHDGFPKITGCPITAHNNRYLHLNVNTGYYFCCR